MEKIFLVSTNKDNNACYFIAEYLSNVFNLNISNTTITMDTIKDSRYTNVLNTIESIKAFKNNALLYSLTYFDEDNNQIIESITMDDYYNNDIFCLSIEAFLNISESRLTNCVVIWIDDLCKNCKTPNIINYIGKFEELIQDLPYLYFNESMHEIKNILNKYFSVSPEEKLQILQENS